MKNFALIGAAGYVAPRHMKAIAKTGNKLVAALDKSDSVGIIDSYFPQAAFFTEFERFDRHIEKLKRKGQKIDFVSVCSPNYLHDAHIRFGLRQGADVICEKPLVLNPWNLEALRQTERETENKIFTILQLRLHPAIIKLKEQIDKSSASTLHEVDLTYITSRGKWYYASWKGELSKSGGIATNIGIHFYDILSWIFGPVLENIVHIHTHDRAAGLLKFKRANVKWFLSINNDTLPEEVKNSGLSTFRSITINGEDVEFSGGFTDLHTRSYEAILKGQGFSLQDAAPAIQIVHDIRSAKPIGLEGNFHQLAILPLSKHPFQSNNIKGNHQ